MRPYDDLRGFLDRLEAAGLAKHVTAEVDPQYELGAICARSIDRDGPALIFENIKGYPGDRLVSNVISSLDQLALAFGVERAEEKLFARVRGGMDNRIAP